MWWTRPPPIITLNGANPLTNECHAALADPGATANDACAGSLAVTTNSTVNPNAVGVYTINYTATDPSGNSATNTRTVYVVDTTPPTITCPPNVVVSTDPGTCSATNVALGVPAATNDNCGILSVTNDAPAVFLKGTTTVTWTATDTSGNTNSCTQTVTVKDTQPPTITCPANVMVSTDPGTCSATNVALGMPLATNDNCGILSVTNDAPAVFPMGTTTVTWTVTDTSGNTDACTQTVTVNDTEPPTITCPANVVVSTNPGIARRPMWLWACPRRPMTTAGF